MKASVFVWIVVLLFVPSLLWANEPSFEGVTSFVANPIEGDLLVTCPGTSANWKRCRGNMLNPTGSFAHFKIDGSMEADKVILKSTWENEKSITKRHRWNRDSNQTERAVNLWVDTLFQNPLLGYGWNEVEYTFTRSETDFSETHSFSVFVEVGETLFCPRGRIHSPNRRDCDQGNTSICLQYFREHNHCR